MPHWICQTLSDRTRSVIFMDLFVRHHEDHEAELQPYVKFQATQDISDNSYATLWNLTLGVPNAHHGGPELTQFEKANAIDALIGLGYACKRLDAEVRGRLYDEFGNLEEMSWYWETLLNKFTSPETTGMPQVISPTDDRPTRYRCSRLTKE